MTVKQDKKGFTLIEMMIVVAIIGILAAIVMANFGSAQNAAIDARLEAEAHECANELAICSVRNNGVTTGCTSDIVDKIGTITASAANGTCTATNPNDGFTFSTSPIF